MTLERRSPDDALTRQRSYGDTTGTNAPGRSLIPLLMENKSLVRQQDRVRGLADKGTNQNGASKTSAVMWLLSARPSEKVQNSGKDTVRMSFANRIEDMTELEPMIHASLARIFPKIAAEWYHPKNCGYKPADFSYFSSIQVWWQCSKNPKHIYTEGISSRVFFKSDCTTCNVITASKSIQDLGFPQSDEARNAILSALNMSPDKLTFGVCPRCSIDFLYAAPAYNNQHGGINCPYCGALNSLNAFFENFVGEVGLPPSSYDTEVLCCSKYLIHGVTAFCPTCAVFNSRKIYLRKLQDLRTLCLDNYPTEDSCSKAAEIILSQAVADFDGYGRSTLKASVFGQVIAPISFQNLVGAQKRLAETVDYDISKSVEPGDWEFVCRCFQKRHLLAHNWGVVDDKYVRATNDQSAVIGRRIGVTLGEMQRLIMVLERIACDYFGNIAS